LLPNLIPALQWRPDKVLALASSQMQRSGAGARFLALCVDQGLVCEVMPFPASGFGDELEAAQTLAADIAARHPGSRVQINATGGTKTMVFAVILGLNALTDLDPFYCDTANGRLQRLSPRGRDASEPIRVGLGAETMLAAQGFVVDGRPSSWSQCEHRGALTRRDLTAALLRHALAEPGALAAANAWTKVPAHGPFAFGGPLPPEPSSQSFLHLCCELGLVEAAEGGFRLAAAPGNYLEGGRWLEEFCELALVDAGAADYLIGVKVARSNDVLPRAAGTAFDFEFDAVAAHRNRLLLIEAKTSAPSAQRLRYFDAGAAQVVGPFGSKLFISPHSVGGGLSDRAATLGIGLVCGPRLRNLRDEISSWMRL
jgi:hypothetical protein